MEVCYCVLTQAYKVYLSLVGGFQFGDASQNPGDTVVQRSIALNEPIIYVSANYRVSGESFAFHSQCFSISSLTICRIALGFLGGKEAQAAGLGNAGLRDRKSVIILPG